MRRLRYRTRRPRPQVPRRTHLVASEALKAIQPSPTLPNRESQVRTYDREKALGRHGPRPRGPQLERRGWSVRPYIEARRLYASGRPIGRRSNEAPAGVRSSATRMASPKLAKRAPARNLDEARRNSSLEVPVGRGEGWTRPVGGLPLKHHTA